MALKLALLGKPKIEFEGEDVNGRLPFKSRILFYYLASNPQTHDRGQLAEWIWNDATNPRGSLRVALKAIRDLLGENIITATRNTLTINQEHDYVLDVEEFDNLIQLARKVVGATERAHLRDAVELYQGDFLEDVIIDEGVLYDEWLLPERERLRQQALDAYDRLVEMSREQGDYETGIRYAQALLQVEPWRESAHRHLMWLYDHLGRRAHALNQFDRLEEVLAETFDVSPTEESFALYRQIMAGEVVEEAAAEPEEPAAPFLAPKLAPFFSGRDEELVDLQKKLQPGAARQLVGLVGPPGVGKTALAIELAHRLRETFPDGVLWMNADLDDPMSVAERWATAYSHDYSRISDLNERTAVLRDLLAEKQALIICDDVTNAARTRLFLPEKGRSTILLTSRSENLIRRLGAKRVNVPVMSLANGRTLLASIISEERVAAEEEAAAEIITLLEGLPLAIAIAGQRLAQQSRRKLALFAAQLGDESARIDLADKDRAIRTSFAVSWNGLDQIQRGVFTRLAVFAGRSFAVDAVTAIAEMDYFEALDRLDALVALSLLNDVGDERYRQHALLADFAREKLGQDDNPYRRMIAYYRAFAANHNENYAELELEWENLSASIEQAHRLTMWQAVVEFADLLHEAWFVRGRYTEARTSFRLALQAAESLADWREQANCQLYWGRACLEQGVYDQAQKLLQDSLRLFKQYNDLEGEAEAKYQLSRLVMVAGNREEAARLLHDSRSIWVTINHSAGIGKSLYQLARIALARFELQEVVHLAQRALEIQLTLDDRRHCIPTYRLLSNVAIELKEIDSAEKYSQEALLLCQELSEESELSVVYLDLLRVAREKGDYAAAERYGIQSVAAIEQIGDRRSLAITHYEICRLYEAMDQYEQALSWAERSLALAQEIQYPHLIALDLTHIGDCLMQLNRVEEAKGAWEEAKALAKSIRHDVLVGNVQKRLQL